MAMATMAAITMPAMAPPEMLLLLFVVKFVFEEELVAVDMLPPVAPVAAPFVVVAATVASVEVMAADV